MAEPVLLGSRVQVLHDHQAATGVGKEACGQEASPEPVGWGQGASSLFPSTAMGAHPRKARSEAGTQDATGRSRLSSGTPLALPPKPPTSKCSRALPGACPRGGQSWALPVASGLGARVRGGPHLYLASRPHWPARSRCSPQRPSGADAPRQHWRQRHSARTRTGRWGASTVPGSPPLQLRLSRIRLGPAMKPGGMQAPRRRKMAGTRAPKPT